MPLSIRHIIVCLLISLGGMVISCEAYAVVSSTNCMSSNCSVLNGGWTISTSGSEKDITEFSYNGINHLFEEEYHLGFDTSIPMDDGVRADRDISDTLWLSSATSDSTTGTIVTVFTADAFKATVTRQLTAVSTSGATLMETIFLENLGELSTDLWLIEYNDWDLNNEASNDLATYDSGTRTFTQTAGITVATVRALTNPDHFDIGNGGGETPILFDNIVAGHLGNNAGPEGGAGSDMKHAFEYDLSISGLGSVTLQFEKRLASVPSSVPALSLGGLLLLTGALGLLAFFGYRRRYLIS